MYISRIDGKLNSDLLVQRDTLINANTFIYLGRKNYSPEQLAKIKAAKERQKQYCMEDNTKKILSLVENSLLGSKFLI